MKPNACILTLILLFGLFSLGSQGMGQSLNLAGGNRIRITASRYFNAPAIGNFERLSGDSLYFRMNRRVTGLPLSQIQILEKSAGLKNHQTTGTIAGAVAGGLLGGLIFYGIKENSEGFDKVGQPGFAGGFVAGALIGGGAGFLIGRSVNSDIWKEVKIKR